MTWAFIAEIDSKNNDLESDGHKSASVKLLSKKEGADLIRAITLASFHGADVLMAAYKQNHCSLNFSVVWFLLALQLHGKDAYTPKPLG